MEDHVVVKKDVVLAVVFPIVGNGRAVYPGIEVHSVDI